MERDRNLLFGILAVQLKGLSPAQMAATAAAWLADPSVPLAQRLVEQHLLTERDRVLLERLADEAIRAHGGDTAETLLSFGGEEQVRRMFPDPVSWTELDAIKTVPMTRAASLGETGTEVSGVEETPGRYTMVSHYAKGGMGRVLLVHDEYLARTVAFKELLPVSPEAGLPQEPTPIRQTASLVARFLQEAKLTGQLEHPSIVPVYELGRRQDGTPYYTMKLVKGKTLYEALRGRRDLSERLALLSNFVDLCQAIAYAHSRGVIHRDIKPGNVMVGQFGETVVLDWGLAKVRDGEDVNIDDIERTMRSLKMEGKEALPDTAYGLALGTPHYMPPEQAEGRLDAIDERSDVYSLGAVLYEILTNATPYTGKSTREVLDKVINSRPTPVLEQVPDVPPALAGICEKALQRNPADRYQSAVELAEDVQRFVTGSLVRAYQYSMKEMLAHYYKKHRAVVNTVLACVMTLAVVGVYSYISILQARDREHEQRLIAEGAQTKEALARRQAEHAGYLTQLSLMQEHIGDQDYAMANKTAQDTLPGQRGWEWGYLLNRANPELMTVSTYPERVIGVIISPDGCLAATATDDGLLQTWDMATGALKTTFEQRVRHAALPVFSPDGTQLVTVGEDENIRIWGAATGKLLRSLSGHAGQVCHAEFSSDGSLIVSAALDGTAKLWAADTGALLGTLQSEAGNFLKAILSPDATAVVTVSGMGEIRVWNRKGLTERFRCKGGSAVFSTDGSLLATTEKNEVAVWDVGSGACLHAWSQEGGIRKVRFSRSSDRLLTAGADGTAHLWDIGTGTVLTEYVHRDPGGLDDVSFLENDAFVVCCGHRGTFSVWEARTGFLLNVFAGRGQACWGVDFGPGGKRMVSTAGESFFQVWDPLHQTGRRLVDYGPTMCRTLAANEQAGLVATVREREVWLLALDGDRAPLVHALTPLAVGSGATPAFTQDGTRMVLQSDPCTPSVWNVSTYEITLLSGHRADVRSLAFDGTGDRVVTGSDDMTARVWNAQTGACSAVLEGHEETVNDAKFSPDGKQVLTASSDATARLWDAQSGRCLFVLKGHLGAVACGVFSGDGRRAFTGAADGTVRAWDVDTGRENRVLQGHSGAVYDIALDRQGAFLVTSSHDGTTRLWDAVEPEARAVLQCYAARILPAGSKLITSFPDGRIETWDAAPWHIDPSKEGDAAAAREAFAQYRGEDYQSAQGRRVPNTAPAQIIVTTSDRVLAYSLQRLVEALQQPETGGPATADTLLLLGLRADDVLIEAGGQRIEDGAAAILRIQEVASGLQANASAKLDMLVLRDGARVPVIVVTRPCQETTERISLHREEAGRVIQSLVAGMVSSSTRWTTVPAPVRSEETLLQEAGMGVCLLAREKRSLSPEERLLLLKAGLSVFDRIVRADKGGDLSAGGSEAAVAYLEQVGERVASGAAKAFFLDIQRGNFVRKRLEYAVE